MDGIHSPKLLPSKNIGFSTPLPSGNISVPKNVITSYLIPTITAAALINKLQIKRKDDLPIQSISNNSDDEHIN